MGFIKFIADWVNENPGSAIGALLGFVFGILMFTVGFWKMLILLLLIAVGYVIGKSWDRKVNIMDEVRGLFRKRG